MPRLRWTRQTRSSSGDFRDRKSTRLNSSHMSISYAVFCLKKKKHKMPPSHETANKEYGPPPPEPDHQLAFRSHMHEVDHMAPQGTLTLRIVARIESTLLIV